MAGREGQAVGRQAYPTAQAGVTHRIGLVSYDFSGKADFLVSTEKWPPGYDNINRVLDRAGCDLILYPLLPVETPFKSAVPAEPDFSGLASVRAVFSGVEPQTDGTRRAVAWMRESSKPRLMAERVQRVRDSYRPSTTIAADFEQRVVGDAFFLFGGEINALTYKRNTGVAVDNVGLLDFLRERSISTILNPASFYMRRWEIKLKRQYISEQGVVVVTLWNKKAWPKPKFVGEASLPWTVYRGGEDVANEVNEIRLGEIAALGTGIRLATIDTHPRGVRL